jgi:hypothetical protein
MIVLKVVAASALAALKAEYWNRLSCLKGIGVVRRNPRESREASKRKPTDSARTYLEATSELGQGTALDFT